MQDTNRAAELFRQASALFDQELANPNARPDNVAAMAQIAATIGDFSKLEGALKKLVACSPPSQNRFTISPRWMSSPAKPTRP